MTSRLARIGRVLAILALALLLVGVRLGDLVGADDADVLTLEEIERAYEEGREPGLGREAIRR